MKLATCHPNRKHQARGLCGACYQKWLKENNPELRERVEAYQKSYHSDEANKKRHLERMRSRRRSGDPGYQRKRRSWMLTQKYGITADDYDRILAEQGGGCAICGRKPGKTPHHVDHCHDTGVVRGVLCHQCNWYLGTLEASPTVLTKLLSYMERLNDIKRAHQPQGSVGVSEITSSPVADNGDSLRGARVHGRRRKVRQVELSSD